MLEPSLIIFPSYYLHLTRPAEVTTCPEAPASTRSWWQTPTSRNHSLSTTHTRGQTSGQDTKAICLRSCWKSNWQRGLINAGGFFRHLQGGYGRHLASDRLSFSAKNLSFLGENLVFFMFSVIKIWPCLRSAEFKSNFFEFFWLLSFRKSAQKNPLL